MFLKAENLTLKYKDGNQTTLAVDEINLEFPSTGLYGILGPSGSGKSSLLYLLSGLKKPTHGHIFIDDKKLPTLSNARRKIRREKMGYVFQQHFLINYLTVEQNILVGALKINEESRRRAKELLHFLDMSHLARRKPYQLSGGQRQRVAIARAFVNNPQIVFVDEPTSALDHKTGANVVQMLEEFSKNHCVVLVTHDESILKNATKIFRIWDGKLVNS